MQEKKFRLEAEQSELEACFIEPRTGMPGVLFVHGWGGSQARDVERARTLARLGCVCLTFDMRGHGEQADELSRVTREDNLADIVAAYDRLSAHPLVDPSSIAVIASSYGAYLSTILTKLRAIRWLALRVPALYRDAEWETPKSELNREDIALYRSALIARESNRALAAAADFEGDALIVASGKDHLIPRTTTASYVAAFVKANSLSYRIIDGADHALSTTEALTSYQSILQHWMREMIYGAR